MSRLDQLCVITDEISQDFEHALDVALEYGVKNIDLRKIWNKNIVNFTDDELNRLKDAVNKRNMKVCVITGPIGKCSLKKASENLSNFNRIIEISDFFNTPFIRIFTIKFGLKSNITKWNEMKNLLKPIITKAEELNKILLLENDIGMNVATIEQCKRFFDEMNSQNVKLLLDPGNFFMVREPTTPDAYEYFYENNLVGHIHIKDPSRKLPKLGALFGVVGEGKIDYIPLFKQAIDHGYKGFFSLETHSLSGKEKASRKSLEYMAKWLEEL
jgi:sugar phosphate isomerase/epimerase